MTHPDRWRFSGLDLRPFLIDGAPPAQDDVDLARDSAVDADDDAGIDDDCDPCPDTCRDDLLADWDDGWRADDAVDRDDDDPQHLDADEIADPRDDYGDPAVDYSADYGGDTSADFPADPTGPAANGFKRKL